MSYVYSATTEGENTVNILLITNLLIFSFIFTNEFVVAADEVKVSSRFDKFRKTPKKDRTGTYLSRNSKLMRKSNKKFVDCFESEIGEKKADHKRVDIRLYVSKELKINDVKLIAVGFVMKPGFKKCIKAEVAGWELENPTGKKLLVSHKAKFQENSLKASVKRRRS
jgi:hypothetical protein